MDIARDDSGVNKTSHDPFLEANPCKWGTHVDSCKYDSREKIEKELKNRNIIYPWGNGGEKTLSQLKSLFKSDSENVLIKGEDKKTEFNNKKDQTIWLIGSVLLPERIDKKFGPEGFYYKISKYISYLGKFRKPVGRRKIEIMLPPIDVNSKDFKNFSDSSNPKKNPQESKVFKAVDILRWGKLDFIEVIKYFIDNTKGEGKSNSKICEAFYMQVSMSLKGNNPLVAACTSKIDWDKEKSAEVKDIDFYLSTKRAGAGEKIEISKLASSITKCTKGEDQKRFIIVDVFLELKGGEGMHSEGHANYIVFDIKNHRVTRIEPHGMGGSFYSQDFLDCFINTNLVLPINKLLKKEGDVVFDYTNDDVDPNGKPCKNRTRFGKMEKAARKILPSPQSYGERGSDILRGTCATWSIYITILYILYPKFRIETIHEIVAENDPGSRLLKFLYRIYNFKNKVSPPKKNLEKLKGNEVRFSDTGDKQGDVSLDKLHEIILPFQGRTLKNSNKVYYYATSNNCDSSHPKFNCDQGVSYNFELEPGYNLLLKRHIDDKTDNKDIFKVVNVEEVYENKKLRDSVKVYNTKKSVLTQGNKEGLKIGSAPKGNQIYARNFYEVYGADIPPKDDYKLSWVNTKTNARIILPYLAQVIKFKNQLRVYFYDNNKESDVNHPKFKGSGKFGQSLLSKEKDCSLTLTEGGGGKVYQRRVIVLNKDVPFTSNEAHLSFIMEPYERNNKRPFN